MQHGTKMKTSVKFKILTSRRRSTLIDVQKLQLEKLIFFLSLRQGVRVLFCCHLQSDHTTFTATF